MTRRFHLVLFLLLAAASLARAGETIDRIVALVNGRPVMESDMVQSLRLEQLLGNKPPQTVPPEELRAVLGRLVDRLLLTEQMDLTHFQQTGKDEVQRHISEIRNQRKDEDWRIWLESYDLSESDVADYIAGQIRTTRFIDARLRPTARLEPGAIAAYYNDQFVPKIKHAGTQPPPMKDVEPQIREILMQQRMNDLLENWLKTLRTQSEIRLPVPSSTLVDSATHGNAAGVR